MKLCCIHDYFRLILTVDDSLIPPGTVLSRVANRHLYVVLLQLTTETARIVIETQVSFDAQDGHRALVALANFYAPMSDGREKFRQVPKQGDCGDYYTIEVIGTSYGCASYVVQVK